MGKPPRKPSRRRRVGEPSTGQSPSPHDIAGPHRLPQHQRVQAAVSGPALGLGERITLQAIRDPGTGRWALYWGSDPRTAIWADTAELIRLACAVIHAEIAARLPGSGDPSPINAITPEDLS